jgi:hypothetical protein
MGIYYQNNVSVPYDYYNNEKSAKEPTQKIGK